MICLSCSDDETNLRSDDNYVPMSVGNYWVYQTHIIKLDGSEILEPKVDSVVITGDSIIDGHTFYVYEGTDYLSDDWRILALRRADGDDIIDPDGQPHFSATNFSDTLYQYTVTPAIDEWITFHYQMHNAVEKIVVPAGEFDALDFRGTVRSNIPAPYPYPRLVHNYYASDVGLVLSNTFSFAFGTTLEQRLVRYYIQD